MHFCEGYRVPRVPRSYTDLDDRGVHSCRGDKLLSFHLLEIEKRVVIGRLGQTEQYDVFVGCGVWLDGGLFQVQQELFAKLAVLCSDAAREKRVERLDVGLAVIVGERLVGTHGTLQVIQKDGCMNDCIEDEGIHRVPLTLPFVEHLPNVVDAVYVLLQIFGEWSNSFAGRVDALFTHRVQSVQGFLELAIFAESFDQGREMVFVPRIHAHPAKHLHDIQRQI